MKREPLPIAIRAEVPADNDAIRHLVATAFRSDAEADLVDRRSPAYYGRFGFEHSALHGIEIHLPDWAPAGAAQVKRLAAFDPDDASLRGRVIYPPAFDELP